MESFHKSRPCMRSGNKVMLPHGSNPVGTHNIPSSLWYTVREPQCNRDVLRLHKSCVRSQKISELVRKPCKSVLKAKVLVVQTHCTINYNMNPRITARVAKRAKVMFSQVFVILSLNGGVGGGQHQWSTNPPPPRDQVRPSTPFPPSGPGQTIYPPPPGLGQNVYPLPPWTRSECLPLPPLDQVRMSTPCPPGPGQNVYPLPPPSGPGQNVYPLPPWTRSECLPLPPLDQVRMSTPAPLDQVRMSTLSPPPSGPGQNVYPPPPPPLWTRSECLPLPPSPPPPPVDQVRTSTPSPPPQTTRRRAVRILLECILVRKASSVKRQNYVQNLPSSLQPKKQTEYISVLWSWFIYLSHLHLDLDYWFHNYRVFLIRLTVTEIILHFLIFWLFFNTRFMSDEYRSVSTAHSWWHLISFYFNRFTCSTYVMSFNVK